MPEEFGLEQGFGQRPAVHGVEALVGARAVVMNRLRHQFFPGPTFPANQHRGARVRHHGDFLVDFEHLRAVAHQAGKLHLAAQLPLQVAVLANQFAVPQRPLNLQHDFVDFERLGDIVEGARLHRFNGRLHRSEGRDQDNLRLRLNRFVGAQHVQAIQVRPQAHVADDDVEELLFADFQGFLAAAGGHHPVALVTQDLAQQLACILVVVHHQNVDTAFRFHGFRTLVSTGGGECASPRAPRFHRKHGDIKIAATRSKRA